MISDHTIDLTLIELARTIKALKALRAARKASGDHCITLRRPSTSREHAAAKRASMDLTHMLSKLRAGK